MKTTKILKETEMKKSIQLPDKQTKKETDICGSPAGGV